MPQFSYIAVNKSGDRIKGMLEAPNESEVRVILRSQQLRPVRINKAGALEMDLVKIGGFVGRASEVDVLTFTRQLAILITSGIPLVQGLDIIAGQVKSGAMRSIVLAMKEKITGGAFLWEAMRPYKDTFPDIYVSMIRAGEASGALDAILKRLIKYLDDAYRLKKLVKGAMIYPIAVILVGIGVVALMMVFVIPKFEELLKSSGQELPGPTQFVITMSHAIQHSIHFMLGGAFALYFIIRRYLKTDEGKSFFDYYALKIPLFGSIILKVSVARFARTMQTLLASGVNLMDALDICRDAVGNKTIGDSLTKMRSEVEQGKSLAVTMSKMPIFPSMVVQMITVGESTGNMDKMLERVSEFYEDEVQNLVGNLTKLIEPVVLVVLGGMVAGLMIAMYLPIFKMAGGVGG